MPMLIAVPLAGFATSRFHWASWSFLRPLRCSDPTRPCSIIRALSIGRYYVASAWDDNHLTGVQEAGYQWDAGLPYAPASVSPADRRDTFGKEEPWLTW